MVAKVHKLSTGVDQKLMSRIGTKEGKKVCVCVCVCVRERERTTKNNEFLMGSPGTDKTSKTKARTLSSLPGFKTKRDLKYLYFFTMFYML